MKELPSRGDRQPSLEVLEVPQWGICRVGARVAGKIRTARISPSPIMSVAMNEEGAERRSWRPGSSGHGGSVPSGGDGGQSPSTGGRPELQQELFLLLRELREAQGRAWLLQVILRQ